MLSEKPDLGAHFPEASSEQWAQLVEKIMKGRSVDSLVRNSDEGVPIRPLYTQDSASLGAAWPDGAPFTRGSGVLDRRQAGWEICQLYELGDLSVLKERMEKDLSRGVHSVWLKVQDGDAPGLAIHDFAALNDWTGSVDLKSVPVILDGGRHAWALFNAWLKVAEQRGSKPTELTGAIRFDPLSDLLRHGSLEDPAVALDDLAHAVSLREAHCPELKIVSVSGLSLHNAGAHGAQELGFILASLVYYLRELESRGHEPEAVVPAMGAMIGLGRDMFSEIAKVRALRTLWSRALAACGVAPELQSVQVHGVSSSTTQSRRDPWVNMLRSTSEAFAGTVAGVDTLTVLPFDRSLGAPSSLGYRMSGNLQVLLAEEAHLGRVADPAGGSWFLEELTKALCENAWAFFQDIEKAGGALNALSSGFITEEVNKVVTERRKQVSRRKAAIVGVSEFPENADLLQRPVPASKPARSSSPLKNVEASLSSESEARLKSLREELDAGASFQDIYAARQHSDKVSMPALSHFRWAQDWEDLRDRSDQILKSTGQRPRVFLAKMGALKDHKARAAFAERFFLAGGFETCGSEGFEDAAACLKHYHEQDAARPMGLVLCGTDSDYERWAVDWAKAFGAAQPPFIALAGRGGEQEDRLREAGVSHFIHLGCDGGHILSELQDKEEASQ